MATLTDSSVDLAGVLLVVSTAMRVAVLRWQARPGVGANEIAYLRGGPRAVIATALAGLYVRGVVGAARPGMVKRLKTLPPDADSIQRAVYLALYRPNGPRGLSASTAGASQVARRAGRRRPHHRCLAVDRAASDAGGGPDRRCRAPIHWSAGRSDPDSSGGGNVGRRRLVAAAPPHPHRCPHPANVAAKSPLLRSPAVAS